MNLQQRIERLEALDEIRQLAAKFALAADMHDIDALAGLFVEDVAVDAHRIGREHLKPEFARALRQFTSTAHHVGNHIIEFESSTAATGIVYCQALHEMDTGWFNAQLIYHDTYALRADRWYYAGRRTPLFWYVAEIGTAPAAERKVRWPDRSPADGMMHAFSAAFDAFKSRPLTGELRDPADRDQFITRIRGGAPLPLPQYSKFNEARMSD